MIGTNPYVLLFRIEAAVLRYRAIRRTRPSR